MDNQETPLRTLVVKNCKLLKKHGSSSAGVFELLAEQVITQNGLVFGSAFDSEFNLEFICAETVQDLQAMRGSKYVFGSMGNVCHSCLEALQENRTVLFIGLPCQVHALNAFLGARINEATLQNQLLTVDLICHGAPSNELFKKYILWLSKKEKADNSIDHFAFRSQNVQWGDFVSEYSFTRNGKKHTKYCVADADPYYSAFLNGIIFRKCCYSCRFATPYRESDITLGDAWGVEDVLEGYDPEDGASLVLLNTPSGLSFFETQCEANCFTKNVAFQKMVKFNSNLCKPTPIPSNYETVSLEISRSCASGSINYIFDELLRPKSKWKCFLIRKIPYSMTLKFRNLKNQLFEHL